MGLLSKEKLSTKLTQYNNRAWKKLSSSGSVRRERISDIVASERKKKKEESLKQDFSAFRNVT